ncbi:MAG: cell division protein ZapE [Legionella sp.]|nr:cell division protein ZapE [Legionella sp.]
MNLIAQYDNAVARGDIVEDALQRQLLSPLETLSEALQAPRKQWFNWGKKSPVTGVYLYGPVGVGKTFLMDLFYDDVAITQKKRFHFHHFMQQIDAQLRRLQGQKNPLKRIAMDFAKSTQLLCFDEFMVEDVAHAMILAELLQALFDNGVALVATSNTRPDDLYLKGLHRERFIPAITAIKSHCQVVSLGDKRDYRLGRPLKLDTYIFPLGNNADQQLASQFEAIAPRADSSGVLTIQNREIPYLKRAENAIWFDFKVICNLPRSQLDYLEIAEKFDTIFISDIPALSENDTIFALLLVNFIDVMYDRGIRLILSAAVPIDELYKKGEMSQDFKRTYSRLQEMQSTDYLQRHPRRDVQNLENTAYKNT